MNLSYTEYYFQYVTDKNLYVEHQVILARLWRNQHPHISGGNTNKLDIHHLLPEIANGITVPISNEC
jgi:hypothetical protein